LIKVVWVNGCFDILHRGHFEMLRHAKSLGDYLIVGLDDDAKVKQDKGPSRPYNSLEDRKFALQSTRYVDKVVKFDSAAQLELLIKGVSPSVMVVGSDWKGKPVIGSQYASNVEYFERIDGYSTTNILENNK
tara:strand:- start:2595 stop:2990 length:396 start_codon:yes stop_codon:yes gene_type:complete